MNKQHDTTKKPGSATYGAYSPVRLAGMLAFVSGQVGKDPLTGYIDEDPIKQASQALRNVAGVLGEVGMSLADVVDTTVFVTDMDTFAEIDDLYRAEFEATAPSNQQYPSRTFVAVAELPRVGGDVPVKVEIKAVAMGHTI